MAIILIVDDEEMERVLEKTILEGAGHQLLFAGDGEAALKICKERDVDILITDLAMPGFSGLRLIRELRLGGLDLRIIAVSGWAADQLDLASEYGADITLFKPIEAEELKGAIEEALMMNEVRDPTDLFGRDRTTDYQEKKGTDSA
jgi:CheY-like chemotaxis protein